MIAPKITIGDTLTCAETGARFVAASDGFTFNYATNAQGEVFSDAGVDARERRAMLDRSRPFACYVSSDGHSVTGWKGNILGAIVASTKTRAGFGGDMLEVTVRDVHGSYWHGRGAGRGMYITLRASKRAPR